MTQDFGTYTYTARNANNPDKVVTFTLDNGHMRVNLTGILDQTSRINAADDKKAEIQNQLSMQAKPAALKLAENISGPFHISDVNADLEDDRLRVSMWQRAGGLRLAPVRFNMGQVDNIEAAEAFVDEVQNRQTKTESRTKFFGPLDYWIGWIGLGLVMLVLFRRPRR